MDLTDKKKMKRRDNFDDEPRIILCNLCHQEDASIPKFQKSEVKLDLSEKEQEDQNSNTRLLSKLFIFVVLFSELFQTKPYQTKPNKVP